MKAIQVYIGKYRQATFGGVYRKIGTSKVWGTQTGCVDWPASE